LDQSIHIRGVDMLIAQRGNGVEPLLVSHHE
jgi:hypothetical protein